MRRAIAFALCALMWTSARAQEGQDVEPLELRVSTAFSGMVVVDRGSRQRIGDSVVFHPRGGPSGGTVVEVDERARGVELTRQVVPSPVRAEVFPRIARGRRGGPGQGGSTSRGRTPTGLDLRSRHLSRVRGARARKSIRGRIYVTMT